MAGDAFGGVPDAKPRIPFGCTVEPAADVLTIRLRGEFDLGGVDRFTRAVEAAMADRPEHVILDLRGLTFIDSSGLTAIMGLRSLLRKTTLTVMRGPDSVQRVFEYTGLDSRLTFVSPEPPPEPRPAL